MITLLRWLWKIMASLVLLVFFVVSLFYVNTTIYDFPENSVFSGDTLFNPYENLPDTGYRANFHAHSIAWKEVTNGHNTEKDIFDAYTERGYDIAGISNYHNISDYAADYTNLYVPVYEHGYNVFKSHYLSISPESVSYFDYPLFQLSSHQQKIIENLRDHKAIIAMAHPKFGGGRSFANMETLVNYDLTEVLNHYRVSDEHWDKALSAGRLTWIMGNDDTHDIVNEPTFLIWNIIYSDYRHKDSIMQNMLRGKNYAVKSENGIWDNRLVACTLDSGLTFSVEFDTIVETMEFIGQDGEVKQVINQSDKGSYSFTDQDSYIRVVARNKNSTAYLNPILRYDGKTVPLASNLKPTSNSLLTWLFRIGAVLISFGFLFLIRKTLRKR